MNAESNDPLQSLLFETSPFGNVDAIVEQDGRAVFFYLAHRQGNQKLFPTRACWVRNLTPGPLVINRQEMEQGIPPQLPRTHTVQPTGGPVPDPDDLHIVWLEEGNGAALCEVTSPPDDPTVVDLRPLSVIPPWSGQDGFHGYAAECASESPICWPMPAGAMDPLMRRLDAAREFWQSFQGDSPNPFQVLQPGILAAYRSRWGEPEQYFSIDGGHFPPRGMVRFRNEQAITLLTVAMSLCPQPNVELAVDQPGWHRRVEIGIQCSPDTGGDTLEQIQQRLGTIAAYPWQRFSWFGQGHNIELLPNKKSGTRDLDFAAFATDPFLAELGTGPSLSMPTFRGDPVNLLWLIPVSKAEQQAFQSQDLMLDKLPRERLQVI